MQKDVGVVVDVRGSGRIQIFDVISQFGEFSNRREMEL